MRMFDFDRFGTAEPRRLRCVSRAAIFFFALGTVAAGLGLGTSAARAAEPIGIAVIAPTQMILGKPIVNAAKLAVSNINASGGVNGRPLKLYVFDDHISATNAVRAFQKAVQQDHVAAGVGAFASEVALALEPWAGRLKVPFIVTSAISPKISREVHDHYAKFKYMFMNNLDGQQQARNVCLSLRQTVVGPYHAQRAVIMAEDADWSKSVVREYQKCLPKAGLKVLKTIRYSVKTDDFSPIYNQIENLHPQVIVAATAIDGLRPIVQWRQDQVPALLAGINAQSIAGSFWNKTNGATQGVMSVVAGSINGVAVTPKTRAFFKAYVKRFGSAPPFSGYTTYDAVHMIAHAIDKAGNTHGAELVHQLEVMRYVGVNGRYRFYGKHSPKTHGIRFGKHYVTGLAFQWQHGQQVATWPSKFAQGKVQLPKFVKTSFGH